MLAITILLINSGLRPLSHRIHPMLAPADPVETFYAIHLTCGEFNEEHLRSLLLTTISQSSACLQAMHSVDDPASGQVQLSAELSTMGQQNHEVERIALRLSIEPGISELSWELTVKTAL
jgi:putative Mg2+ transporter-C (MgtC) family protein